MLTRLLLYLTCIASMPAVRRQAGSMQGMRLPGGLLIPGLAVFICLALLTQVKPMDYLATGVMLGVGSVLYALARRRPAS